MPSGGRRRRSLCKSPRQRRAKLQPACLARACSMWSRNPMPVLTAMCCELLLCEACAPLPSSPSTYSACGLSSCSSVSGGNRPPSRLMARRILVSLVLRWNAAQRVQAGDAGAAMGWEFLGGRNDRRRSEELGDRPHACVCVQMSCDACGGGMCSLQRLGQGFASYIGHSRWSKPSALHVPRSEDFFLLNRMCRVAEIFGEARHVPQQVRST